jgi:hypothetical protein
LEDKDVKSKLLATLAVLSALFAGCGAVTKSEIKGTRSGPMMPVSSIDWSKVQVDSVLNFEGPLRADFIWTSGEPNCDAEYDKQPNSYLHIFKGNPRGAGIQSGEGYRVETIFAFSFRSVRGVDWSHVKGLDDFDTVRLTLRDTWGNRVDFCLYNPDPYKKNSEVPKFTVRPPMWMP